MYRITETVIAKSNRATSLVEAEGSFPIRAGHWVLS
jgi:hypothetical protein